MSVIKFDENNFDEMINSGETVIVDFYADWCGPCKMMSPIIESISEELEGQVQVGKVNTDENMGLAEKYEIMSIPTIIIFKNGKALKTVIGLRSKQQLLDELKQIL